MPEEFEFSILGAKFIKEYFDGIKFAIKFVEAVAKTIKHRGLIFVAFFSFCNVINRKNQKELENYHKRYFCRVVLTPHGV